MRLKGSCHCGNVTFEFDDRPEWAIQCNCSVCRRLGARWIYSTPDKIRLVYRQDATIRYAHGDRNIAFHTCRTCGCTTHWENLVHPETGKLAVNLNMAEPAEENRIRVRHFDGADTWTFIDENPKSIGNKPESNLP